MGIAGRAIGLTNNTRIDYPYAGYNNLSFNKIATEQKGDIYARFKVRIKKIYTSIKIIQDALKKISDKKSIGLKKIN